LDPEPSQASFAWLRGIGFRIDRPCLRWKLARDIRGTMKLCLLIFAIPHLALCGELMDLGHEDLAHLIYDGEPGSHTKLENELRGGESRDFIEKFKDDPRLRKVLVSFPKLIPDQDLREEVILYALREPAIWDFTDEENPGVAIDLQGRCAFALASPLGDELGMAPGDPDRSKRTRGARGAVCN
jgi:hypothetical protein